jgi:hypothetical protein
MTPSVCWQLLVGGGDREVLALNQRALEMMRSCREKQLVVIPEASHLFEEPGALEQVAAKATDWFRRHLHRPPRGAGAEGSSVEGEQKAGDSMQGAHA